MRVARISIIEYPREVDVLDPDVGYIFGNGECAFLLRTIMSSLEHVFVWNFLHALTSSFQTGFDSLIQTPLISTGPFKGLMPKERSDSTPTTPCQ